MRILAVLLTVCLVGLGHCRGDNNAQKGVEKQNPPKPNQPADKLVESPVAQSILLPSKIDASLFDTEESLEDTVKVLKLKAKEGASTNKVLYDGRVVWKAKDPKDACSLVFFYLGPNNDPVAALYRFKRENDGKTVEGYRQFSNGKWNPASKDELIKLVKGTQAKPTESSKHGGSTTLDISKPDKDTCQSFDYTFAANTIRLIVPNKDTTVTKLVNNTETVWTAEPGETFDHTRVYLNKDGKAELVLVVTTSSGASKETYFELKDGKWTVCNDKDAKIKSLRDLAEWKSDFDMDISADKDTKECTIFEADLLGVTTKHFYPKPGHLAMRVKNGNKDLWTGISDDDCCLSCLIYKKGNVELLDLTVVEGRSRWYKFFEKSGDGWTSIEKDVFLNKLKEIKEGHKLSCSNPSDSHPSK